MGNGIEKIILDNKDLISIYISFSTLILIIIGWVIISLWNSKLQKKNLYNSAKIKVYEEFSKLQQEINENVMNLSLIVWEFGLPFNEMDSKRKFNNGTDTYKEEMDIFHNYLDKHRESISKFCSSYLKLWVYTETWIGLMPKLNKSKKELFEQLSLLQNNLYGNNQYLIDVVIKEYDWQKWDKDEIKKQANETNDMISRIASGYIDDFMTLVHNELVTPILGYKKKHRENFINLKDGDVCNVLTKNGIEEIKIIK